MTNTTQLVSNANRIRTKVKPYAVGIGAVLALLLTAVLPPAFVENYLVAVVTSEMAGEDAIENALNAVNFELVRAVWTTVVLGGFIRYFDIVGDLRKQEALVRTVAAGAGLLVAFIVGYDMIGLLFSVGTGSVWDYGTIEALLDTLDIGDRNVRLIGFGVALYVSLSRGHSVVAHRDTFLVTYLTLAVLATLENVKYILEELLFDDTLRSFPSILEVITSDLLSAVLIHTVVVATFAIVFAYGIERYGAVDVGGGRSAVADGGEK